MSGTRDTLLDYHFVDEERLQSLIEQVEEVSISTTKTTRKFNASLTGPSIEFGNESNPREPNRHEKIGHLVKALERRNLLSNLRPIEFSYGTGKPFILETTIARKVTIPQQFLKIEPKIQHLSLWIADPDHKEYVH
jgi:hypothetical protein